MKILSVLFLCCQKFYVKGAGGIFDIPPVPLNNPLTPFTRVLKRRTAVLSYGSLCSAFVFSVWLPPYKKVIERRNQKCPPLFSLLIIVSGRQMFGIAKILGGSFFFGFVFSLLSKKKMNISKHKKPKKAMHFASPFLRKNYSQSQSHPQPQSQSSGRSNSICWRQEGQ